MGLTMLVIFGAGLGWFVGCAIQSAGETRLASLAFAGACLAIFAFILLMLAKDKD